MTCADLTGSTTRYRIFDTRSVSYERAQGSPAQLRLFLALGISAAVSIFGLVEAALIKPLPCRDQTRLVAAFESSPSNPRCSLAYLDFIDWKSLNSVFGSLDAYGQVFVSIRLYLYGDQAAAAALRGEPLWHAWMNERFPPAGDTTSVC